MNQLAEWNNRNRAFWIEERKRFEKRLADPALYEVAFADLASEEAREVELDSRMTLEQALADAERTRALFSHYFGRKGGQAKQPDDLQKWIIAQVRKNPRLQLRDLERLIEAEAGHGFIVEVTDTTITFMVGWTGDPDVDQNKPLRDVPRTALKHRLTRARKFANRELNS
ncbi:MAG: hypothetical protein JOY90_39360 [Bradyrhizobium sp.]|uniref:hypothetical protein n=1 Tax=Bradyrhizobium sp. TaxID=376 RepID=UPI001D7E5BBE|nr:hypothetical protein [Bradyrhizobium sp.]MBV9566460.1 hypothetical protein [Bradyrhizobium sp.]